MEELKPWDWGRIMIGNAPAEFLLEIFLRTLIVYPLLLMMMRLLGKRMSGQISIVELAVMITLGAIVSPGMQLPDRAILFVPVALVVILLLYQAVNILGYHNEKFEHLMQGKMTCLVKDGIMQLEEMRKVGISRQELFAQLRNKKLDNLANVERAYLEACGIFSVYTDDQNKPGLLLYPEKDTTVFEYKNRESNGLKACCHCGNVQKIIRQEETCHVCRSCEWIDAYSSKEKEK